MTASVVDIATHTHNPTQWCTCPAPQHTTAYGFAYCGRCRRGFEPEKKEGSE